MITPAEHRFLGMQVRTVAINTARARFSLEAMIMMEDNLNRQMVSGNVILVNSLFWILLLSSAEVYFNVIDLDNYQLMIVAQKKYLKPLYR